MPNKSQFTVGNIPLTFSQEVESTFEFPVLLVNDYKTWAGEVNITDAILDHMEHNFNQAIPHDKLPIDEKHQDGPAPGWIEKVMHKVGPEGNGLYVAGKWTKHGKELRQNELYRYVSADFWLNYVDSEFGKEHGPTLCAVALTNRPMLESLPALFSKDGQPTTQKPHQLIINFSQKGESMDLKQILAKSPAEVTDEEKAFLQSHVAELTDEQRTTFGIEAEQNGDAEAEATAQDEKDAAEKAQAEADAAAKQAADASNAEGDGKQFSKSKTQGITLSQEKYDALLKAANAGADAKAELDRNRMGVEANQFIFSQTNENGNFLPKSHDKLTNFMFSLNAKQLDEFKALMAEAPKGLLKLTQEAGDGGAATSGGSRLNDLAQAKVTAALKAGNQLSFTQALDEVTRENPELAKAEYTI